MSENHTDSTHSSPNHIHHTETGSEKPKDRPRKNPSANPDNLSEQLIAETLQGRRSKCSHGCGSEGNGCATGGCGVGSLVEMIANNFNYTDERRIVEVTYAGYRRGFAVLSDEDIHLRVRDGVVVRNQNGLDWASVTMTGSLVHAKRKAKRLTNEDLPKLLRKADESDLKRIEQCKVSEQKAYSVCKTRIEAFDLPMTLVGAEWQFDHKKLTFYFTADGRVDFRDLVRDLAAIFNTRIELRQIPVRDAAKRLGGMGVCGLELCCTTHLGRYEHVTLDHAKIQQIPANPSKLSGQCGRLKCCLLYEVDTYVEGLKRFPPIEGTVKTEQGTGVIHKIDLFKDLIYLHHPETSSWETLTLEDYRDIIAGRKTKKQREAEAERKRVEEEQASLRSAVVETPKAKPQKNNNRQDSTQARRTKDNKGKSNRSQSQKGPEKKQGRGGRPGNASGQAKASTKGRASKASNAQGEGQSQAKSKASGQEKSAEAGTGKAPANTARTGQKSNDRSGGKGQRRPKGRGGQKPEEKNRPNQGGPKQDKGPRSEG